MRNMKQKLGSLSIFALIVVVFASMAYAGWKKESQPVEFTDEITVKGTITASGGVVGDVTGNVAGTQTGPVVATTISASG
ncbi:MAG: hypothetical protein KKH61_06830, partial [Gammaproteobacteria bacterium]|nr:hypothetical protein [Gammaproteobacteria bacterium]